MVGGSVPTTAFLDLRKGDNLTIKVEVRNGNLEQAMRVLKRKVQKEGLVKEIKERQYYSKPSEIKREAKKQGIKNTLKRMKKLERIRGF